MDQQLQESRAELPRTPWRLAHYKCRLLTYLYSL